MEIKIQCDCGQRYKLDVEPINSQMPWGVNCPVCGVDGTPKGNALIQQAVTYAASPPVDSPPSAPAKLKLSLGGNTHAPAPPASVEAPALTATPVFPGRAENPADHDAPVKAPRKPSFGLGLLGGCGGALVGALLYYVIVKTTGLRISYFAIGVGGLAGWMAELIGKGEGSKELAGITATLSVAFIIAAQYFIALSLWHTVLGTDFGQSEYDVTVRQAREAVKLVPTGSDTEIRNYLANEQADADGKAAPSAISDDDVKQFRDTLPGLHDLAAGKVTRDQFNTQNGIDPNQEQKKNDNAEGTFKSFFILLLIKKSNLFSIAAAAALAFRLSANA